MLEVFGSASARSSSTRSRSPAGATTSCSTPASRTTSPPGATACTSAARSSRRTTRACPSSRRAPFPWFRGTWKGGTRMLEENAEVAARVLERIRADGPLSSGDFERRSRADDRLVRRTDEHRARRARRVHRHGPARPRPARRQQALLRPPRAVAPGRRPCAEASARGAAPAQASVAVPRAWPARRQWRRRRLRRDRPSEARPRWPELPGRTQPARASSSRRGSSSR